MPPTISVIIPAHNAEKTIQETIESVLKQSFTDFELIVVNDGSSDRTLEIVSQIQDPRLKVLSCSNYRVAISRNLGFKHSTGKYVSFLDSDDLWTPDKLEAQFHALEKNPEAAVAYSWTNCIDEQGKLLRRGGRVRWSGNVLPQLLLDDFIGNGSNVMIRREIYAEMGGFDEEFTNAEDTDLWLRIAAKYPFVNVPSAQVLYRVSRQSKSSRLTRMEACNLKIIERSFAVAPAHLKPYKTLALGNLYKYLSYKALDVEPGKQQTQATLWFLWQVVKYDTAILKKNIIPKALLKLMILALLPRNQAQTYLNKFPKLADTSTFLGYEIRH